MYNSFCFNKLNKQKFGLKFILEVEENKKISFLDTLVKYNSDKLINANWFSKSSFSGRILNFNSYPLSKIIIKTYGFIYRVMIC